MAWVLLGGVGGDWDRREAGVRWCSKEEAQGLGWLQRPGLDRSMPTVDLRCRRSKVSATPLIEGNDGSTIWLGDDRGGCEAVMAPIVRERDWLSEIDAGGSWESRQCCCGRGRRLELIGDGGFGFVVNLS